MRQRAAQFRASGLNVYFVTINFLDLDRDLQHCREREAATIADVNKLIDGLQTLDSRLTER